MQPEPVICSILYALVTTFVSNSLRSSAQENIKFEIITPQAAALCAKITEELHASATIVEAHALMVLCVVSKHDVPQPESIILTFPGCVVFKSTVADSIQGKTYI